MSDKIKAVAYCRMTKEEIPKTAIYCRVASADVFTINAQAEALRNYAEKQRLDVGAVFLDNGVSGLTLDRPAFQKMMTGIKNGEINCVLVKSICRVSRDSSQFVAWFNDMRERNVRVITVSDGFDSREESGYLTTLLRGYFEQTLQADMSERIKRGIAASRQRKIEQAAKFV